MIVKSKKNIVGPQVRMLRHRLGLKQKDLAARLQILGWDIESGSVSKIECQIRLDWRFSTIGSCRSPGRQSDGTVAQDRFQTDVMNPPDGMVPRIPARTGRMLFGKMFLWRLQMG